MTPSGWFSAVERRTMGLIIDYFRCDPFELNFRLLVFSGYWPLDTKTRWLQVVYSIYSYLCWFSIISMLFIQVIDIYLLRNDPLNLIQNMCASVVTFASITKFLLIFYQTEQILELHNQLKDFQRRRVDPADTAVFKKADKQILWSTRTFYGLALPCVAAWMLYPGLDSSEKKRVPFPYRLPTDDWSTPIYEILYTYQSMSMIGFMIIILSNDLVFWGFIIRINAQYDMLIKKLEETSEFLDFNIKNYGITNCEKVEQFDPTVNKKVRALLKKVVAFHQKIIGEIDELKQIYCYPFLIHALADVTLVTLIVIDVVSVSKGFNIQILQRMMYTVCGIFDTYLHCLYATSLQNKSVKLFRAMYSTPWYRLDPKTRRELLIILLRANKTPVIMIGNLLPLNLYTFLQFLKTIYNMSTLLYQTIRK